MAAIAGKQLRTLAAAFHYQKLNVECNQVLSLLQVRSYAARKGTREKAKKKKAKVEVKKTAFDPTKGRNKITILPVQTIRQDDRWKSVAIDDVWLGKYHRKKIYSFAEAVECHRETHEPTCYDSPNALLNAFIELDMKGEKKNKVVEKFSRTVAIPHIFDYGEKKVIMAFAKTPELLKLADAAGAALTGNIELISKIQKGEVSVDEYSAVVAHPEIMAELSVVRGLLKRKFPNPRLGTLGLNLPTMVKKILHGITYKAMPHEQQILCGHITVPIGNLQMDVKQLEENFITIIKDVEMVRPKREGEFITRVTLICPPSIEKLKINFEQYFPKESKEDDSYESDDDEEIVRSNVI